MGIFGGVGPIASGGAAPIELIILEEAAAPSSGTAPQRSQAGAQQSWDTFREYWGSHAPAQAGILGIMRDRFRGIG